MDFTGITHKKTIWSSLTFWPLTVVHVSTEITFHPRGSISLPHIFINTFSTTSKIPDILLDLSALKGFALGVGTPDMLHWGSVSPPLPQGNTFAIGLGTNILWHIFSADQGITSTFFALQMSHLSLWAFFKISCRLVLLCYFLFSEFCVSFFTLFIWIGRKDTSFSHQIQLYNFTKTTTIMSTGTCSDFKIGNTA